MKLLAFALALIITACGPTPTSQLSTVDLPQTAAKAQGGVGFCWSYATIGLTEATALNTSGQTFDLSEEAIGFYRIAEELSYLSKNFSAEQMATPDMVREVGTEGITGSDFLFHDKQTHYGKWPSALELVKKYGVTPESVWSVKFANSADGASPGEGAIAIDNILARFVAFKAAHNDVNCCDVETLANNVMVAPAGELGFPSVPPKAFEMEGLQQTPTGFLAANFKLQNPDFYDVVTATSAKDFDTFVQRTKLALAAGETVPLEFSADAKFMDFENNTFTGIYSAEGAAMMGLDPNDTAFNLNGGHVVLITDFVNVGGKPGRVSDADKAAAVAADPSELDYFVVKNSWGQGGNVPNGIAPGFYLIKKKYLELHMAAHAPDQISTLFVAVPK